MTVLRVMELIRRSINSGNLTELEAEFIATILMLQKNEGADDGYINALMLVALEQEIEE